MKRASVETGPERNEEVSRAEDDEVKGLCDQGDALGGFVGVDSPYQDNFRQGMRYICKQPKS